MSGKSGSFDPWEFRKNLPMYWLFFKKRKKEVSEGSVNFAFGSSLSTSFLVFLIEDWRSFGCERFA